MPSEVWMSMVSAESRRAKRLAQPLDLRLVIREGLSDGDSVRDHLEADRPAFLAAARTAAG